MPAFSKATETVRKFDRHDGTVVYSAVVDQEWSVFGNPHGGYLLALVVSAINSLQSESKPYHPDPAHLTASFLRPANPGPLEIELEVIKKGRNWTNISVKVVQNAQTLILCQALYTLLPPLPSTSLPFSTKNQNLLPATPSPYAQPSPFLTHPSLCSPVPKSSEEGRRWSSNSVFWFTEEGLKWSEDEGLKAKREGKGAHAGKKLELEWGAWMEFKRSEDKITVPSWLFFADMMSSIPEIFPEGERVDPHYYPTMAMSIQFHAKLPLETPYLSSPQTIGCYSSGKFIHEGRHEQLVEVWSAPSAIGRGEIQADWREKSMILVTATQIALSVDVASMRKPARAKI